MISRSAVAVLLLSGVASLSAATIELRDRDGRVTDIDLQPRARAGVIVEFQGTPTSRGASPVQARETLARFRRDLPAIDKRLGKTATVTIRREYTAALVGAAVQVPREALAELRRLPYVRAVHEDVRVEKYSTSTVDAGSRVNAVSLPTRGKGITVAVIDTGIDYRHAALGGALGPGHKVAGGYDFVNDDADPDDDHGHGTHVAGIIAGDSAELRGVAPQATLYAYKVLDDWGAGEISDVIAAIERSVDPNGDGDPADHLDVINMSLGGPGEADDLASRAVDNATAAGVIVVVAAGNSGAVGTIGSPATARTAITVGAVDDNGQVAVFSSRGPSPRLLGFKPDVTAPGVAISSAKKGGGLMQASGTSMAAPHVAGVAALLRSLHPEWTPADVKSALAMNATAVSATPFARGAGRVDAERAAAATLFVSDSGLSFGLGAAQTGTWQVTRTFTVTNRSAEARTFEIGTTEVPAGATLTAPERLELAAGESRPVEVRFHADAALMLFPYDMVAGGDVVFTGAETFRVPWALVRAARTTVTIDAPLALLVAVNPDDFRRPTRYSENASEMFSPPGTTWDFLLMAVDFPSPLEPPTGLCMVVAENHAVAGDEMLAMPRQNATARVELDSRDAQGVRFPDLPQTLGVQQHMVDVRFLYSAETSAIAIAFYLGNAKELLLSPASSKFRFAVTESYLDLLQGRLYNVQHPLLDGVAGPKVLSSGRSSYTQTRLQWGPPAQGAYDLIACSYSGVSTQEYRFGGTGGCVSKSVDRPLTLDYFTTSETPGAISGVQVSGAGIYTPVMRGIDGKIAVTADWTPSPAAYRISDGEEVTIGNALLHPLALRGTSNRPYFVSTGGLNGPLGEICLQATNAMSWTMYDDGASPMATGSFALAAPPLAVPNGRFMAATDSRTVVGHPARAELRVLFGPNDADLDAPTLTSLRVLDPAGRVSDRVATGSAASLAFSAVDFAETLQSLDLRREATKAWYRVNGSGQWEELTVVYQSSDTGTWYGLRHLPAGDLYRVDLSPTTAHGEVLIDLRLEVEDLAGNRSTWTHSPAFAVGRPPKRRSVR